METAILEISLCIIENMIIYVFLGLLLENRFTSIFPIILAIMANSTGTYLCVNLNILIRIPLFIALLYLGTTVLYKGNTVLKLSYILLSLYTLYIIDIILGNVFSLFSNMDITELFYGGFTYRLISCLIIKLVDGVAFIVLYKMLYKTEKSMKKKNRMLFLAVVFTFFVITTVFLQIYPSSEQNTIDSMMYTALSALFFAMSFIVIYFFTELSKGYQRDRKLFLLENNFNTLQEQIAVQQENSNNIRKFRHDMRNHLTNIRALIDSGEVSDAIILLDKVADNINSAQSEKMIHTGNHFVDAIILSKTALCKDKGIDFVHSVQPLGEINIDEIDLSSLLSNLLDNAIESAVQIPSSFVKLTIVKYNAYYMIYVVNSYKGKEFVMENEGTLVSTKPEWALHGYGTQIVSDIAKKYDGNYSWEAREKEFVSTVLLKI